jgi:hypothetical protein
MTRLYPLSYFLTANPGMTERCFVCDFGDCIQRNLVFQKWARSWSRRTKPRGRSIGSKLGSARCMVAPELNCCALDSFRLFTVSSPQIEEDPNKCSATAGVHQQAAGDNARDTI